MKEREGGKETVREKEVSDRETEKQIRSEREKEREKERD